MTRASRVVTTGLQRAGVRQSPRLGGDAQLIGQVLAHQGLGQAIGARDEVPAGTALDAQEFAIDGCLPVAPGVDDALVLRLKRGELRLAPLAEARLGQQGRRRADLDAAPAEDAGGVHHEAVEGSGDVAGEAPASVVDGVHADDLVADAHAFAAEDAVLVVAHEEGVVVLEQRARELEVEAGLADAVAVGIFLQIAGAVLVARGAGERMIRDEEIDDVPAHTGELFGLGVDDETVLAGHSARRRRVGPAFDLHQAEPAAARGPQRRVMAEPRDVDPMGERRVQHGSARQEVDVLAIDDDFVHGSSFTHSAQLPAGQRLSTTCARYSSAK